MLANEFPDGITSLRIEIDLHWNARSGKAQYNSIHISEPNYNKLIVDLRRLGPDRVRVEMPSAGGGRVLQGGELNLATLRSLTFELEPDEKFNSNALEIFLFTLSQALTDATRRIVHIGPLRDMPERAYRIDQLSTSGGSTEHVVGMLVDKPKAIAAVSRALRRLGIAKQVDVVRPAPGYAGIVLSDVSSSRKDNLADVGFGASQVLPILVRLALAPPRALVLVEQPELHLHPEVQGALAEVMVDIAIDRNLSLFVESHSENMLLRLRRLVASGVVEPEVVKVFVTDSGAVSEAAISAKGRIDTSAFPAGFFEEEWEEAMGIIAAGGRRP
ncbi:AAA family ATPase [Micromonospora sp. WMMD730]|uniref:AAA family ATPase n=1 Tax=Micromonospora sp. WMMD730 TaxID=3404128 RepID=UPI003B966FC4